jgi:hypothetical protein
MGFSDYVTVIVFSWPAILASMSACLAGLISRKAWLCFLAAGLVTPFTLYLSGLPPVRGLPFLGMLFLVGSGLALLWKKDWLAWLLGVPVMLLEIWVVINILLNLLRATGL